MYGPEFRVGKVLQREQRYHTPSGRPWGPVVSVLVLDFASGEKPKWWFIEQTKSVGPKLAKKRLKTPFTNQK